MAVAYGKVFSAQLDGHVVALDARTGKVIWKTDNAEVLPQPAVAVVGGQVGGQVAHAGRVVDPDHVQARPGR